MRRCAPIVLSLLLACAARTPVPDPRLQASPGRPKAQAARLLATSTQFEISDADLEAYIASRPKLTRQLYDLRHGALEEDTLDRLVAAASKQAGLRDEIWLRGEVAKHVHAPSDAEVHLFFQTRLAPGNPDYKYDVVAPQIREHLLDERRQEAVREVFEGLRRDAKLQILMPPPRVAVAKNGPSRGPSNAPVTIVEFSDYQCPYCQRQEEALKQILAAYPTQVRLVVRDFPLDMHPDARGAARAAVCADAQGHFWELHDRLLAAPGELGEDDLKRTARAVGLEGARFDACLTAPETEERVAQSQREGAEVGVDGTPALFLNGRPFSGAVSFAELKATVDEELALRGTISFDDTPLLGH